MGNKHPDRSKYSYAPVLAEWLRTNKVDTIQGRLRFNGPSNYGDDLMKIKQVQGGTWKVVWPASWAAPGATLQVR